jgi:ATP-dependent helicase/nuclease subunit A
MSRGVPPLEHERILASAGSGKTFRLSGRAIELIRRGVDPAGFLASTFTRAAAAEIRDRVLGRLARAVLEPKARRELAIGSGLPEPTEAQAIDALERTVAAIDRLQIRTLDSLFASTVMAFAAELGVPPEPRVLDELETARLEDEAIARMLAADDATSLLATIAALNKGFPRLSVGEAILGAVRPVLRVFRQSDPSAWEWPARPMADAEEVRAMIAEHAAIPVPKNGHQAKALAKDRATLAAIELFDAEAWAELVEGGIGGKVRAGEYRYYADLPGEVVGAYEPLVGHALELAYAEQRRHTAALHDLVARFERAFREVKREAGAVTFDDLTMALADASALPDLSEVFFRLDARFTHALLDEFQDTSVPQWRALLPIVREIAGGDPNERSLFVVGDLKQSIYGWRGASPALLEQLPAIALENGRLAMRDDSLAKSFRSSQVVLDAVNAIFDDLRTNAALAKADPAHQQAAAAWLRAWQPHVSGVPEQPGTVELHIAPSTGARSNSRVQQEANLDTAADLIAELVSAHPAISVGVLCRRNAPVASMLNRLRARGVAASARGVGSLLDAASVNAFIATLALADHPDHTVACFHIAHSPLGALVGLTTEDHRGHRRHSRARASESLRRTFERLGYAETFRRWRDQLLDQVDAREAKRLDELIESAMRFDGTVARERRPAEVAAALRAIELDEEGSSGVTVMNIHQSKGLEFDAVVLCDVDQPFAMRTPIAAVREPARPDGPYVRVVRWAAEALRQEEVGAVIDATTEESYREFLSTLYVATTRAKRGLFVVVGPAQNKSGLSFSNSFAGLLRGAWCPNAGQPGLAYTVGSRSALAVATEAAPVAAAASLPPVALRPPSGLRMVRGTSASERELVIAGDDEETAPDAARRAAMDAGVIVHAMMESIEWWTEGAVNAEALRAVGLRVAPRAERSVIDRCVATVERALASPAIRAALTRPPGVVELRREWRFARIDPETGGLEQGAIDRLLLGWQKGGQPDGVAGRPTSAMIFDFKTDRVRGGATDATDALGALVGRYRPQMDAYRRAVAERFGLPLAAVGASLLVLDAGSVIRVDA